MNDNKNQRAKGTAGEDIACDFLIRNGYKIVTRNFQFGHGEIDIIAQEGNEIVFVEVKARKSLEYGDPETAITKKKIAQISKVATAYLVQNNITEQTSRIDAIAILLQNDREPLIHHYENVG